MKKIILSLVILSAILSPIRAQASNRDLETIRERVITVLMTPLVDDARVKELIATLRPDGTWPGINYVDLSAVGFEHTRHLANLQQMCRAYKKKGSAMRGKKELKNAINLAFNHWLEKNYIAENWYNNELATPNAITAMLLMMDKDFTPAQIEKASTIAGRAHKDAGGARQSGDRVAIVGIQAKNALFKRDAATFEMLVKIIEGEMKFVQPNERGMQYDYSFHHRADHVDNTLAYGGTFVGAFTEWMGLLNQTSYQMSESSIKLFIDYYLDGTCKHMVYGIYSDPGARNRDISYVSFPPSSSSSSSLSRSRRGGGMLDLLISVTDYRKAEIQEIIDLRVGNKTNPTLSYSNFFWASEYFTYQRPGFFTSVRMFSNRNANTEQPYGSAGLTNHHRGDGMNYISLTGAEYNYLSPVYDWQKLPGTTVMQKPTLPGEGEIQKSGAMNFVGAVTDGMYGAVGYDFISPHDPIRVRKAWFFFDEEYVCLGADLWYQFQRDGGWSPPYPIVTTLNQCHLRGEVVVSAGGAEQTPAKGERKLDGVRWVYHDGVGYLFPKTANINLSNQAATGSWYTVNRQNSTPKDEVNWDVFKLWIDHGQRIDDRNNKDVVLPGLWVDQGKRVDGLSYQYIVMPGASKEQVSEAWQNPKVEILSNSSEMQAVWHKSLNICQIVCYKNGTLQLPNGFQLVMDSPGIFMLNFQNQGIELSVSDPARKLGKIHLSVNRKVERRGEQFLAVWNEAKGMSNISVDLPQKPYAGKSVTIKF